MLVLFCISLILGATLYSVLNVSFLYIGIASAIWGAFFILLFRNKRTIILGLALGATVILGALRFWLIPSYQIPLGNQALIGVVKNVDERLDKTLVKVRVDESNTDIQVTLREKQSLLPGDKVSIRGKVELPEDFLTETGRTFDYDQYLASKGIEAVMGFGQVVKLEDGKVSFNRESTVIRFWIASVLGSYILFPIDGIVAGMLVGFQGGIPKYLSDIFRYTGTLHTLVLSGYNITVLAGFLGLLFRRLPFKIKTLVIALGITSLVIISGAGVAAVRAGIMGSIALVAGMSLQTYNVFRALLLAFLFFFFTSPQTIFVDPGFHLSFLATVFIVLLLPILNEKITWLPIYKKLNLRELLILACGLPLFMLPYTMYFSGLFPIVSPLANIFLVPIIPILMLGGLGVIIASFLPVLPDIIGIITSFIGSITISVLTFLNTLPQWQTPPLSGWGVTIFYGILFILIFRKSIRRYFEQLQKVFQSQTNSHF
jgi:competence protein ComEC